MNTNGSFECECFDGFTGDGFYSDGCLGTIIATCTVGKNYFYQKI